MAERAPARPLTPGRVKKLLDAALAVASPGSTVTIEGAGVRLSVRKEGVAPVAAGAKSEADAALDQWERENA